MKEDMAKGKRKRSIGADSDVHSYETGVATTIAKGKSPDQSRWVDSNVHSKATNVVKAPLEESDAKGAKDLEQDRLKRPHTHLILGGYLPREIEEKAKREARKKKK